MNDVLKKLLIISFFILTHLFITSAEIQTFYDVNNANSFIKNNIYPSGIDIINSFSMSTEYDFYDYYMAYSCYDYTENNGITKNPLTDNFEYSRTLMNMTIPIFLEDRFSFKKFIPDNILFSTVNLTEFHRFSNEIYPRANFLKLSSTMGNISFAYRQRFSFLPHLGAGYIFGLNSIEAYREIESESGSEIIDYLIGQPYMTYRFNFNRIFALFDYIFPYEETVEFINSGIGYIFPNNKSILLTAAFSNFIDDGFIAENIHLKIPLNFLGNISKNENFKYYIDIINPEISYNNPSQVTDLNQLLNDGFITFSLFPHYPLFILAAGDIGIGGIISAQFQKDQSPGIHLSFRFYMAGDESFPISYNLSSSLKQDFYNVFNNEKISRGYDFIFDGSGTYPNGE